MIALTATMIVAPSRYLVSSCTCVWGGGGHVCVGGGEGMCVWGGGGGGHVCVWGGGGGGGACPCVYVHAIHTMTSNQMTYHQIAPRVQHAVYNSTDCRHTNQIVE